MCKMVKGFIFNKKFGGVKMETSWYKSKTKWAGILLGIAQIAKMIPAVVPYISMIEAAAAALGAFGIRDAMFDIKK